MRFARIWGDTPFVEFDQGLYYCIRQIRLALRDNASKPGYIETLPKQGYRFVANIAPTPNGVTTHVMEPEPTIPTAAPPAPPRRRSFRPLIAAACVFAGAAIGVTFWRRPRHPAQLQYTQLTDFTDSAVAPALSRDGRMLAFIRGDSSWAADQIYVKMLPNGEPRRLTNDPRVKLAPAFSPDGSKIAYTVFDRPEFATYTVSVFGGDSRLLLHNAAGLTWLDRNQLLFSQIKTGFHMGIVTATAARGNFREIYFPAHERGMAHYSYASPDRKSALVVEMNGQGDWAQCRLISLDGGSQNKPAGPAGACTSAGWSPDGKWMYFTASVDGVSDLWRQRFPKGAAEKLTSGPQQEDGIAVAPDGSVVTSIGDSESAIWIHDEKGERRLSSEGEVTRNTFTPSFNRDGTVLYYLLRRRSLASGPELWRVDVRSGRSEVVTPGISVTAYDVSPDEKQVVYSTALNGKSQIWLAPTDRRSPPKQIGDQGETTPFRPRRTNFVPTRGGEI